MIKRGVHFIEVAFFHSKYEKSNPPNPALLSDSNRVL